MLSEGWQQFLSQQKEYVNSLESKLAIAEYSLTQLESKHRQDILHLQSTIEQSTDAENVVDETKETKETNETSSKLAIQLDRIIKEKEVSKTFLL
jgi:lipopolysaccharide biosynthesis regulator YciM